MKALQILANLKAELLSREAPKPAIETGSPEQSAPAPPAAPQKDRKPTILMRHARLRGESWQRYHRGGRSW